MVIRVRPATLSDCPAIIAVEKSWINRRTDLPRPDAEYWIGGKRHISKGTTKEKEMTERMECMAQEFGHWLRGNVLLVVAVDESGDPDGHGTERNRADEKNTAGNDHTKGEVVGVASYRLPWVDRPENRNCQENETTDVAGGSSKHSASPGGTFIQTALGKWSGSDALPDLVDGMKADPDQLRDVSISTPNIRTGALGDFLTSGVQKKLREEAGNLFCRADEGEVTDS